MTVRLPVVGSTAASTSFCSARLDGPDGRHLFFDGNSKITAGNGSFAEPRPNAFSLVNVEDCPGSTPTCRAACYVENLAAAQPDLFAMYRSNSQTIREILDDRKPSGPNVHRPGRRPDEWAWDVASWIYTNAAGGFRWHVSGDIFSLAYARWIAKVVERSPTVRHWIYTRSFDFIAPFMRLENLTVNLSADADNHSLAVRTAAKAAADWGRELRICYLTVDGTLPDDLEHGSVIFMDYPLRDRGWAATLSPRHRQMTCPVDLLGKSEKRRCGPCDRCMK